eukprot:1718108-Pleurochrysis_carterae.AAC.2
MYQQADQSRGQRFLEEGTMMQLATKSNWVKMAVPTMLQLPFRLDRPIGTLEQEQNCDVRATPQFASHSLSQDSVICSVLQPPDATMLSRSSSTVAKLHSVRHACHQQKRSPLRTLVSRAHTRVTRTFSAA